MRFNPSTTRRDMRLRNCRLIGLGCALIALAFCADAVAQPVARPEFNVGDTWTYVYTEGSRHGKPHSYESTWVHTVTRVTSDQYKTTLVVTPEGGESKTTNPSYTLNWNNLTWPPNPDGSRQEIKREKWPLDVGETYTYEVPAAAGVERWRAHVVGWETVDVPAGSFRALKVEREMVSSPNPLVYRKITVWWSPEAKTTVRMYLHGTYEGSFTYQRDTRELVSYSLH
jgi:hypothetical protein